MREPKLDLIPRMHGDGRAIDLPSQKFEIFMFMNFSSQY